MSDLALRHTINTLGARAERAEAEVERLQTALRCITRIWWEPGARAIAIHILNGETDGAA